MNPDDAYTVSTPLTADQWFEQFQRSEKSRVELWNEYNELKNVVREYLKRPSTDGRADRQEMRKNLAEFIKK